MIMKTLWQKTSEDGDSGTGMAPDRSWFFRFTAEEDRELDRHLIPYDILVNIAQARMLRKVGIYNEEGFINVTNALSEAWDQWGKGTFDLGPDDEDVHSAVEKFVTEKAGQDGARIHTGRSRNDQVLADMRLFMKESAVEIAVDWIEVAKRLEALAKSYNGVMFAGMTHTQPAMPHSVDAWAAGYLDLLLSDVRALQSAVDLVDQSPLGSAAGYGVPYIRVDREFVSEQLGFARVQVPVAASQLSRGRFEMQLVDALGYGALTFNRLASDVVLFMHPSWSLVTLSEDQVSGSSIMPQKRNPDAWELIRGAYHDFQAARSHLAGVSANLTSGYHRDLQVVKKSVMAAVVQSKMLAEAVRFALDGLEFDKEAAKRSLRPEIFATHQANKLVAEGMPFREAYQKVVASSRDAESGSGKKSGDKSGSGQETGFGPESGGEDSAGHTAENVAGTDVYYHTGAPGSGVPSALHDDLARAGNWVTAKMDHWERTKSELLS